MFLLKMPPCSWRIMEVIQCFAIVACFLAINLAVVRGQDGFISIDCGLSDTESYIDNGDTNFNYTSDKQFVDTGINNNIAPDYWSNYSRRFQTLRSFPEGVRNCYTLRSLKTGKKYLIYAAFVYGNYDGLNKLPTFDLYFGVNFWTTVKTVADEGKEIITVAPSDYINICLVNTGHGIPFISELLLRPMKSILYPDGVNETLSLDLWGRYNLGPPNINSIRYPVDPYDRIWYPRHNPDPDWTPISTTENISVPADTDSDAPSAVLQTAITSSKLRKIDLSWTADVYPKDPDPSHYIVLYFAELQQLAANESRQFNVLVNNELAMSQPFSPEYLSASYLYSSSPLDRSQYYNVSLVATNNSSYPPLLNALELFYVRSTSPVLTDFSDVSAINAIRIFYGGLKGNWSGDPCLPKSFTWDGLSCRNSDPQPSRITAINLSSRGLSGTISTSFANLTALESLDLSHNNLSGPIPQDLSQLTSLKRLDLTGNNIQGPIPDALLQKSQSGSLTLRVDGINTGPTTNDNMLVKVLVPVAAGMLLVAIIVGFVWHRITRKPASLAPPPQDGSSGTQLVSIRKHQFTHKEVETITNNFQTCIGEGGFGKVYKGSLEDCTHVAVKIATHLSAQGLKGFKSEAEHLMKVYHKNLVSLIGYCNDRDCLALIYEYMPHGNLLEHLRGTSTRPLLWGERVRIAYESAQGLEYLHALCKPPIIHRDVKTSNILLSANREAKIADFGLSKSPQDNSMSHLTTFTVAGTPGYIDPQYHATGRVTVKSDVYSFGIVLFEIVTGKPAIISISPTEKTSLVHWVRPWLARGDVESIIDKGMPGRYDINSVLKVADIANKCTAESSVQRPTMTEVVMQLKDCMELVSASWYGCSNDFSADSNDAVEGNMGRQFPTAVSFDTGPSAR